MDGKDELIVGDEVIIKIPDGTNDATRNEYESYNNAFTFVTKIFSPKHGFYVLDINDHIAFPRTWLSPATSAIHHDDEFDTGIGGLYE